MASGRSRNREAARAMGAHVAALVRAQKAWAKSVNGWLEFLEKLALTGTMGDEQWKARMRAHYIKLIQSALANPPAHTEAQVRAFRFRLDRV